MSKEILQKLIADMTMEIASFAQKIEMAQQNLQLLTQRRDTLNEMMESAAILEEITSYRGKKARKPRKAPDEPCTSDEIKGPCEVPDAPPSVSLPEVAACEDNS